MPRSFVLGVAGHIDHGKTSLVAALTGVDTDRLPEEKQRGVTIDLGFAHFRAAGVTISVVDVPGHERFIRNMLAGATGIDAALLVVAADDSVMPQTREHLAILTLLGVSRGVIAVTKADLVAPELLPVVVSEVRELAAGGFLADAPIVATSARTGHGMTELGARLGELVATIPPVDERAPFRLPIDRSFLVRGVGTVVTGTVWSGSISTGNEVELQPSGRRARVRKIQRHGESAPCASEGERAALNLSGAHHTELARGEELATPGYLKASRILTVELSLLASAPASLAPSRRQSRIRLAIGSKEVIAKIRFLEGAERVASQEGAATPEEGSRLSGFGPGGASHQHRVVCQLLCESPVCAVARQPFVIRSVSPMTTIGGGIVLEPQAKPISRRRAAPIELLRRLAHESPVERLAAALERLEDRPYTDMDAARLADVAPAEVEELMRALLARGDAVEVTAVRGRSIRLHRAMFDAIAERILSCVRIRVERDSVGSRTTREAIAQALAFFHDEALQGVLKKLESTGALHGNEHGVMIPGLAPAMTSAQRAYRDAVMAGLASSMFRPPDPVSLAAPFGLGEREAQKILDSCVAENMIVRVAEGMYLDKATEAELVRRVRERLADGASMAMSDLRDMLDTTRKFAVPIGEYLDRLGVTRRRCDVRVLAPGATAAAVTAKGATHAQR